MARKTDPEELQRLREEVVQMTDTTRREAYFLSRAECVERLADAGVGWAVREVEEYARLHSCEGME